MNPETKNDPAPVDPDDATAAADQVQRKEPPSERSSSETAVEIPSPAPAVVPATPTVSETALAAAVSSVKAEVVAIAELCQLAGQSNRIATFLTQGLSAAQVRQAMLASRAQSEEITSHIAPDAVTRTSGATSDGAVLMAAVKKLTHNS